MLTAAPTVGPVVPVATLVADGPPESPSYEVLICSSIVSKDLCTGAEGACDRVAVLAVAVLAVAVLDVAVLDVAVLLALEWDLVPALGGAGGPSPCFPLITLTLPFQSWWSPTPILSREPCMK